MICPSKIKYKNDILQIEECILGNWIVFPRPVDVGNVTIYCTSLTDSFFLCVLVASSRGTISIRKSNNSFLEIAAATSLR
jgi:hypothetical protein